MICMLDLQIDLDLEPDFLISITPPIHDQI